MNQLLPAEREEMDEFDDSVLDIDFASFASGPFRRSMAKIRRTTEAKQSLKKRSFIPKKPLTKEFNITKSAKIFGTSSRKMGKIIVPDDRPVIVEGVSKFILSQSKTADAIKNIGYYKGKKLNELVFIFNNNSPNDFTLNLFDPSMPLDYLHSTTQNINNKIQVAGGSVSYTDVLFNILANPIIVRNAKFVISGPQIAAQQGVSLQIQDKFINGVVDVVPMNLMLQIDTMQVEGYTISFDIADTINRAFVPDGMDVIGYRILAGNTVTMCFYYEQKSLKKLFYPEARKKKERLDSK